jgi:hypothetical protein
LKTNMQNFGEASLIGTTAYKLLSRPDFSARVIAVVSNAVYLVLPPLSSTGEGWGGGEIVWLAQSHLPMHPRAILGAFDFSGLHVGAQYTAPLPIRAVPIWSPPETARDKIVPLEIVMERARELQDPKGFAKPFGSLRDLIGLGEGLTPAGDDFVGGFLFARYGLHQAYSTTWDQNAVDELIESARARTNEISFAILRDYARGHSVAPMHDLLIALASRNKTSNAIQHHVRRLISIGNTSGKEMLAGFLAAFRID